jgi:chemotaxis protein methyltransferase CheR
VQPVSSLWQDPILGDLARELYLRFGLVFEGGQGHLFRKRLTRRAAELGHPAVESYLGEIKAGKEEAEYDRLVELLTVNETYFFREEEHFQGLLGELWPGWVKSGEGPIRVWSAGCSLGCEPYTLAILLKEKGLVGGGRPQVEIMGSDVSTRVLEEAKTGLYGEFALRNTSPYYRQRYFSREGSLYRLSPEIRAMVSFRRFNLLRPDNSFPVTWFHAVFCRNVLIYFDTDAKQRTVEYLVRSLRPDGALIIGRSESLFNVSEAPPMVSLGGVLIHRKGAPLP